jgi:hypothetical protein
MSVEPQGGHSGPPRRPDLEEAWPILGALVTFIVTWQLTHDLGIAVAAASVFLAAFPPRRGPNQPA